MNSLSHLSDAAITNNLKKIAAHERTTLIHFLDYLMEVEVRRLYAPEGFSSLFAFCLSVLKLTEAETCARSRACRLMRQYPVLRQYIATGQIGVGALRMIAPVVTEGNFEQLFARVANQSIREVEAIVAGLAPKRDVPDQIRKIPNKKPVELPAPQILIPTLIGQPVSGPIVQPLPTPDKKPDKVSFLTETRVQIKFSADESLDKKLKKVKELAKGKCSEGNLEAIINMLCEEYLERHDPDRKAERQKTTRAKAEPTRKAFANTPKAKPTRYIPRSVKAIVWKRDHGQCTFRTSDGHRCGEKTYLEYDHQKPFALGGSSDNPENVRLLCRAHNRLHAEYRFGKGFMANKICPEKSPFQER
ncbi:MAG: HNH endonuclease [Oligoflexales bacterium]